MRIMAMHKFYAPSHPQVHIQKRHLIALYKLLFFFTYIRPLPLLSITCLANSLSMVHVGVSSLP
jgi:hypothetical protein